jgi:hypothetical protein
MVPKTASCYCMLLMWSSDLNFLDPYFTFVYYTYIITTATGRQPTDSYINDDDDNNNNYYYYY